jgi:Fe-S-cluster containining protein
MGKNSIHFKCVSCGHCCTDVICLPTPGDVVRIAKGTGENPHDFLEFVTPGDITGVKKSDPTWLEVNGERYLMALNRGPKGCYFLDKKTKKCSIYGLRPLLCRLFPFLLHETRDGEYSSFGLHTNVGCPKHRTNEVATRPLYEIYLEDRKHQEDYEDLVTVFNNRNDEKRQPSDFIQMFYDRK